MPFPLINDDFTMNCLFCCKLDEGKYEYTNKTIFEEILWFNNISCAPGALSDADLCFNDVWMKVDLTPRNPERRERRLEFLRGATPST